MHVCDIVLCVYICVFVCVCVRVCVFECVCVCVCVSVFTMYIFVCCIYAGVEGDGRMQTAEMRAKERAARENQRQIDAVRTFYLRIH